MDATVTCPFTVLIDTAESTPWGFQGIVSDANKDNLPMVVPVEFRCLGRHPESRGDYSVKGLEHHVAIERKSQDDAISTILGWDTNYQIERGMDGRRNRFKQELQNLAAMPSSCVIVEAPLSRCMIQMPGCDGEEYVDETGEINAARGVKTVHENRKIFFRSIVSWNERYRVNWLWCEGRRAAEIIAFRFLEKSWEHYYERLSRRDRKKLKEASQWQGSSM